MQAQQEGQTAQNTSSHGLPVITAPLSESQARITHVRRFAYIFRANVLGTLLPDSLNELRSALSPQACAFLDRAPAPEAWVPTDLIAEIREAYRRLFHLDAARVRGMLMIEHMLASGALEGGGAKALSPRALLEAIVRIFPETHQGGLAVLDACETDRAQVTIWALFPYPQYLGVMVPEIFHTGLHMVGCEDVRVDYLNPEQAGHPFRHVYTMTWKA